MIRLGNYGNKIAKITGGILDGTKINIEDINIEDIENKTQNDDEKIFELPKGCNMLMSPDVTKKRIVVYIAGSNGSGKSYKAAEITKEYMEQLPNNKIYMITDNPAEDPAFSDIPIIKLQISKLIENKEKIKLDMFTNSLVIFDDVDNLRGESDKFIRKLKLEMVDLGRKLNISVIITNHMLYDASKTKYELAGCDYFVLFPRFCRKAQIEYFLKRYMGLKADKINEVANEKVSRWVAFNSNGIPVMIKSNSIELL